MGKTTFFKQELISVLNKINKNVETLEFRLSGIQDELKRIGDKA